ncbi:MAG TPA: hypothetical protein VFV34_19660 [Blastocatellia bacterium]|nr:hypothetical protein [Blastocatellia bacterium]
MTAMSHCILVATLLVTNAGLQSVRIDLAHSTEREQRTRAQLDHLIASYDLRRYTFTRAVVIEEGAVNHAFPVLTLNARFADSPDELLSSYLHEQLHWHLREHLEQQQQAIVELRRMYPGAPVGLPEGAETAYSTYGHLVDCYLEIQADRRLIGQERTETVISKKPHYTWIYKTVLKDEARIGALVARQHLALE